MGATIVMSRRLDVRSTARKKEKAESCILVSVPGG